MAIRTKLEANAALTKNVLGKELPEEDLAKKTVELVNQRKKAHGTYTVKKLSLEEIWRRLQTEISKIQRIDEKMFHVEKKLPEVKEAEPVIRIKKKKEAQKQGRVKNVDKSPQGDSETDEEESVEAMNPTPLDTKSNIVVKLEDISTRTMFDPPLNKKPSELTTTNKRISWSYYIIDLDLSKLAIVLQKAKQIQVFGPTLPMQPPEYPEYLVPSDVEAPLEDQPLPTDASPSALSPGYVVDSDQDKDPEEDLEEDHANYLADGGDGDDEPSDDDDEEEPIEDEDDDEEEAWKTVRLEPPMSPSMEARIAEYAAAPTPPSPPPSPLSPWSSPLHQIPLPPLPPLPASLSIPPLVDHREDILEADLPPRKRLCLTTPISRYEVEESSTAAPRPTGGHRADYGFINTMDAEIRRQRAEEVGYGIRDVWVDPTEAIEEEAPMTLERVNGRVTELAAVQEQDTQDIYVMIEDAQDIQTQLSQRFDVLIEDRQFHHKTALLLDQEALVSREAWAHSVGLSSAGQLSAALGQIQALRARDQTQADDLEGAGSSA
ncbi:hypothetical protein Tco_1222683 [Tanacetum coccineum]